MIPASTPSIPSVGETADASGAPTSATGQAQTEPEETEAAASPAASATPTSPVSEVDRARRDPGAGVPPGFAVSERTGPLVDTLGPIYVKEDEDGIVIGILAQDKHLNARGFVHGALICLLADLALGRNCSRAGSVEMPVVTASLSVDVAGRAEAGEWLEASATVTKRGRRLCFAHGLITGSGRPVAQCSAVFAVAGPQITTNEERE